ncbi:hypothetical protein [Opitutus sp. ER46]|uniref:hypothetical protein n=1 Tax=Opitutus sp. ER46 TaxID=2161864 RepID=UPI000D312C26|nr:hypothetical protein [Opitutus sp. ER46]PTX91345.1 hypothetical protein DB354_15725 [Opitutus sp. ER46]
MRQGNALLGEAVAHCREADLALAQVAAERQDIERVRAELDRARDRAEAEAGVARSAMAQLETQRAQLSAMRDELLKARGDLEGFQRAQHASEESLQQRLTEAREQQQHLEAELERLRRQGEASRTLNTTLGQLDLLEGKLRVTERELAATRHALDEERGRRDRAIALIKPRALGVEETAPVVP